jgi:hypothetical protein
MHGAWVVEFRALITVLGDRQKSPTTDMSLMTWPKGTHEAYLPTVQYSIKRKFEQGSPVRRRVCTIRNE